MKDWGLTLKYEISQEMSFHGRVVERVELFEKLNGLAKPFG
jgi:hypothetical protein